MANLSQLVVGWAGAPVVGPGVSVFYCLEGDEASSLAALHTFFTAINNYLPSSLQWTFPGTGDKVSEVTGQRTGSWVSAAPAAVSCIGSGTWTNGVGMRVKWRTAGVKNGRNVVGATFLVPLVVTAYEGAGNITSAVLGPVTTAAAALAATTGGIRVWSRPDALHTGGAAFPVTAAEVPDKVSWLRSRRT